MHETDESYFGREDRKCSTNAVHVSGPGNALQCRMSLRRVPVPTRLPKPTEDLDDDNTVS